MPVLAGFMVPHPPLAVEDIGKGDEKKIQKTLDAYDKVAHKIAEIKPDTIIITSPHSIMYKDYFHISPGKKAKGDFLRFGAAQVKFEVDYDEDFTLELSSRAEKINIPAGTLGERDSSLDHGTMVPLYFITKYYTDFKMVRIGLSGLSLETHYNFGKLIRSVSDNLGRKTVFIASGDLSHCQKEDGPYGLKTEGPQYDEKLMDVMKRAAFKELLEFDERFLEKAEECGHRSFAIMGGVFDSIEITPDILSHEATFGVGYGIGMFLPKAEDYGEKEIKAEYQTKDTLVQLARDTINEYVLTGKKPKPPEILGDELNKRAGAFVSVHECGMLRGCIGTISATCDNLAEEIINNAISAVGHDPRFVPVTKEELDDLEINVDVLGEAEEIDSKDKLDVKKYGVIVQKGYKRGLLLPDLDGVDTVDDQISIAKRKAGIRDEEEVVLYRFEVVRHI